MCNLYRAKRVIDNKWIEGQLLRCGNDYYIVVEPRIQSDPDNSDTVPYIKCNTIALVKPETICEYTGLYIRDQVKLFENDVIYCFLEQYKSFSNAGYLYVIKRCDVQFTAELIYPYTPDVPKQLSLKELLDEATYMRVLTNLHDKQDFYIGDKVVFEVPLELQWIINTGTIFGHESRTAYDYKLYKVCSGPILLTIHEAFLRRKSEDTDEATDNE